MISTKEIAKSTRTLICLLQSLVNRRVLLELRNDYFVLGILQSVDCYMNSELTNAHVWSLDSWIQERLQNCDVNQDVVEINTDELPPEEWISQQTRMEYIMAKGCRIRYFYLPEEINPIDCIEQQLGVYRSRRPKPNANIERPFNWKSYRKNLKLMKIQHQQEEQSKTPPQS